MTVCLFCSIFIATVIFIYRHDCLSILSYFHCHGERNVIAMLMSTVYIYTVLYTNIKAVVPGILLILFSDELLAGGGGVDSKGVSCCSDTILVSE